MCTISSAVAGPWPGLIGTASKFLGGCAGGNEGARGEEEGLPRPKYTSW